MKKTLFVVLLTFFVLTVFSQKENNVFNTFLEFKENNPSTYCAFTLKQRTNGNVFMTGGITNFRLKKIKPETQVEQMNKEVWGILVDDSAYINSYPYSKIVGYNKIIEKGYYTYFIGEPARFKEEQLKLEIINEGEDQISVCCKSGFVVLPDGQIKILKPETMMRLLQDNETLMKEFMSKNLKQEDVYEMFELLKKYNLNKK